MEVTLILILAVVLAAAAARWGTARANVVGTRGEGVSRRGTATFRARRFTL
jgi:hypothetical protein